MLNTYKAILKGNHLEWSEDVPTQITNDKAIEVFVTILDKPVVTPDKEEPGRLMAEALNQLAEINAQSKITDPLAWEREVRQDRALPDRNN